MLKTRKSISKRFKVTPSGKLLRRISANNHFNAKERRTSQLRSKGFRSLEGPNGRKVLRELSNR